MEEFTKALEMKRQLSIAYYPQTDGQTKRINQEIGTFLWYYVNYQQDDWTNWLAAAEFQYNDKKYAAIGWTPFKLNFGRHPWKGDLVVQCQVQFTLGWKSAEWTQRWADLWNDLSFSLCAALSVCHMIATSDEGEEVWVGVSTDWCITIEHQRSSSMRVYLCQLLD